MGQASPSPRTQTPLSVLETENGESVAAGRAGDPHSSLGPQCPQVAEPLTASGQVLHPRPLSLGLGEVLPAGWAGSRAEPTFPSLAKPRREGSCPPAEIPTQRQQIPQAELAPGMGWGGGPTLSPRKPLPLSRFPSTRGIFLFIPHHLSLLIPQHLNSRSGLEHFKPASDVELPFRGVFPNTHQAPQKTTLRRCTVVCMTFMQSLFN